MKKILIIILTLALTATISHAQQQREGQRPNREKMAQMQVKRIAKALAPRIPWCSSRLVPRITRRTR